jgi:vacuolar-type H+-ATPase subunit E/Vma4
MNARTIAAIPLVVVAAAVGVLASPREALATRVFAKKEGKACAFCHVNPKGGGPRNATGRDYEANGYAFAVKTWSSDENQQKYLRANSAIIAQWYAEADRVLDDLAKAEKEKAGVALIATARDKYKATPAAWMHDAKTWIMKGAPGVPTAATSLAKLESQFGKTAEGKEAIRLLDKYAKDPTTKDVADHARVVEKARGVVLEGVTEFHLNHMDKAKELLQKALADPDAKDFEKDVKETLAQIPETPEKKKT